MQELQVIFKINFCKSIYYLTNLINVMETQDKMKNYLYCGKSFIHVEINIISCPKKLTYGQTSRKKEKPYTENLFISAYVHLRNYKLWYLDILDIDLYYEDGTEIQIQLSENPNFSTVLEELEYTRKDSETYPLLKKAKDNFKKYISLLLEKEDDEKVEVNFGNAFRGGLKIQITSTFG